MDTAPILSLRGVTKSFPGVVANDRIDLDVFAGEVHTLLGENGAGKSTLMKVVYGFYHADSGEIRIDGAPVQIRSPQDARRLRIGMVFQDFVQIPALSVAENIALFLPDLPALMNQRAVVGRIRETSRRFGLDVDPDAPIWRLSIGEKQKVEILKLLLADAKILILDEPTRSLAQHEIAALFRVYESLRRDGYAVIFITHKLQEVLTCANRVTVLRRGKVVGSVLRAEATEAGLVSMMFGSAIYESAQARGEGSQAGAQPAVELRGVCTRAEGQAVGLDKVDLRVLPGEMVGVAGVSGNGQRQLGDVMLGLETCAEGKKYLWGQDATGWTVARVRASGVAFIPEDARVMGAVPWMSLEENMVLGDVARYSRYGGLSVDRHAARSDMERSLKKLGFEIPPLYTPIAALSGGNVQRAVLARELAHDPKLILAFYPTRGLDLRSAVATREVLAAFRDAGAGVLLISEDLSELFGLCDSLVVLFRGRIVGAGTPRNMTVKQVGYLMTGSQEEHGTNAS